MTHNRQAGRRCADTGAGRDGRTRSSNRMRRTRAPACTRAVASVVVAFVVAVAVVVVVVVV
eukprot:7316580-Alexandrium_andersonii.AAC.1